jgi:HK97 gp10 family phage protein
MARGRGLRVTGLSELLTTLRQTAPREALNLARSVVHSVAAEMGKEVRRKAPVGETGKLKRSVAWKRNRPKPNRFSSRVVVGAKNPKDKTQAFYWKFIEFGTLRHAGRRSHRTLTAQARANATTRLQARPFVLPVKQDFANRMPQIMREQFMKKLQQRLARQANRNNR